MRAFFTLRSGAQIVEDTLEGSRVTFSTEFRLRFRFLLLALIMRIIGKSALRKDLVKLWDVLENG